MGCVDCCDRRASRAAAGAAGGAAAFLGFLHAFEHFGGDGDAFLGIAGGLGCLGFVDLLGDGFVQAFGGGADGGHVVIDLLQVDGAEVLGGEHRRGQQGCGREQGGKRSTFHGCLLVMASGRWACKGGLPGFGEGSIEVQGLWAIIRSWGGAQRTKVAPMF